MLEKKCEKIFKGKGIEIIKCEDKSGKEHFFAVSDGKRIKIGPVEGERTSNITCSCGN